MMLTELLQHVETHCNGIDWNQQGKHWCHVQKLRRFPLDGFRFRASAQTAGVYDAAAIANSVLSQAGKFTSKVDE